MYDRIWRCQSKDLTLILASGRQYGAVGWLGAVIPPLALSQQLFSRRLTNELIVLGTSADPDPVDAACFVNAQCSIVVANTDRPEFANSLEVQRWMARIALEQLVILVCKFTDVFRQDLIQRPEL